MSEQPVAKFRIGFVTAAIWKNGDGFYNVTLGRSYKNDEGQWQESGSLGHGDLLNAAKVLERAESWIGSRK